MQLTSALALAMSSLLLGGSVQIDKVVFNENGIQVKRWPALGSELKPYNNLLFGGIDRGINYLKPADSALVGKQDADYSRLPSCYHHPLSPIGIVMKQWNAFPGKENTYSADARLSVSLIGLGASPLALEGLPCSQLVELHSEPPIAVVGMYVGAMAGYARPFQEIHFFENNKTMIELSVPKTGAPFFTFIEDAKARGAHVKIFPARNGNRSLPTLRQISMALLSLRPPAAITWKTSLSTLSLRRACRC
jgi:hypothetical protein